MVHNLSRRSFPNNPKPPPMDMDVSLGTVEIIVGLVALLLVAPLLQFWTLKLGLNGMREDMKETRGDVKETRKDVKKLVTSEAVHDQRLLSLESRMKKAEADA